MQQVPASLKIENSPRTSPLRGGSSLGPLLSRKITSQQGVCPSQQQLKKAVRKLNISGAKWCIAHVCTMFLSSHDCFPLCAKCSASGQPTGRAEPPAQLVFAPGGQSSQRRTRAMAVHLFSLKKANTSLWVAECILLGTEQKRCTYTLSAQVQVWAFFVVVCSGILSPHRHFMFQNHLLMKQ